MPFATVDDLEARWKPLSDIEKARAAALIDDVTARMSAMLRRAGVDYSTPDDVMAANLRSVTVAVVKRSMMDTGVPQVSSHTMSAGAYSETLQYANPTGDIYLTSAERKLLGIGRMRFGSVMPVIGDSDDSW